MPLATTAKEQQILATSAVFQGLQEDQVQSVLELAQASSFTDNQILIKEDFFSDTIYIVLEGALSVTLENQGAGFQVAEVTVGESVGEFCLLDEKNRRCSATVRSLSRGRLLRIGKSALLKLFHEKPQLGLVIMTNLARLLIRRLEHSNDLTRSLIAGNFKQQK